MYGLFNCWDLIFEWRWEDVLGVVGMNDVGEIWGLCGICLDWFISGGGVWIVILWFGWDGCVSVGGLFWGVCGDVDVGGGVGRSGVVSCEDGDV